VAALVRAKYPEMSAANVVNRLIASATDIADPGRDEATGFGVVNALEALTKDIPSVERNPLLPERTSVPPTPPVPPASAAVVVATDTGPVDPPVDTFARLASVTGGLLIVAVLGLVVRWRLRTRRGPRVEVVAGWEPPPPDDDFW
jgi:hypothetical protein